MQSAGREPMMFTPLYEHDASTCTSTSVAAEGKNEYYYTLASRVLTGGNGRTTTMSHDLPDIPLCITLTFTPCPVVSSYTVQRSSETLETVHIWKRQFPSMSLS
jgi:hypothetical protein